MSPVWAVPVVVLAFGVVAMAALLRGSVEAARELGSEIARFGELHVSLARVRADLQQGHRTLRDLRDR